MKKALLIAALAAGAISTSQATITYQIGQVVTNSVTTGASTFNFNQFNTDLGTLTAIQVFINSSIDSEGFTINNTGTAGKAYNPNDFLTVVGPGSYRYDGVTTWFSTTPSLPTNLVNGRNLSNNVDSNSVVSYTIPSTALLTSVDERSVFSGEFFHFVGDSTVNFTASIDPSITTSGGNISSDIGTAIANTTVMEVIYTYDVSTVPVPEPSQVAASLLLVVGIAGFLIVRRRQALVA